MHTHTSINLTFSATEEKAREVYAFFAKAASPDYDPLFRKQENGYLICTDESYKIIDDTDITDLAKDIANIMPNVPFELSGKIDASEGCGEYMDYRITYKDKKLYYGFSDWYLDYGGFYVLDSGAGPEVDEVPLDEGVADFSCVGLTFVIVGKLNHFKNSKHLRGIILSRAGSVSAEIDSKTDYLINNNSDPALAENQKAAELGVPIISEDAFLAQFAPDWNEKK